MKALQKPSGLTSALLLSATALCLISSTAFGQLNETKIERDAAGIFKGKIGGASVTYNYLGSPPSPAGQTTPYTGKIKVPVKDGKLSTSLADNDLETPSNPAALKGKEQKSKVTRGGKSIGVKAAGSIDPSDPMDPNWTGCAISGSLSDKGSKWVAKAKAEAHINYPPQLDGMGLEVVPALTVDFIGLDVSGAD